LALLTLEKKVGVDYICSHLFSEYTHRRTRRIEQQHVATARLQRVNESATAALRGVETVELVDLPQRVSDVTGALATLTQQESSFDSQLKRTRGALVDNLAKLSQLDADITQAEQELGDLEAANDQEKKHRIQELLDRLRDERASRLEAAAATVMPSVHKSLASGRQLSGY